MDKSKLIDKHLKGNHALICGQVHHFEVTGEVRGCFKGVLIEMLQEFEDSMRGQDSKINNDPLSIVYKKICKASLEEYQSCMNNYMQKKCFDCNYYG